jgi:alkylation response protein AidB-like acyl-CoA dehydrogenase
MTVVVEHELVAASRRWAALKLGPKLAEADGGFSLPAWRSSAEQGVLGLCVPAEHGGLAAGARCAAEVMAAIGEETLRNDLLFSMSAHMWACQQPLVQFGTAEQKRRYLPALVSGEVIGAHAASELDAGSDVMAIGTTASRAAGGWVIDGSKTLITNAPVAGLFVVLARTSAGPGFAGLSAFLVARDTPGLSVAPMLAKLGLDGSPMSGVTLSGCEVPEDACLGGPGAGFAVLSHTMTYERALILAPAVGVMAGALRKAVEYARSRHQFGRPIGAFDAVRRRIVRMRLALETSRDMLFKSAQALDDGTLTGEAAALTKLHVSESYNVFAGELLDVFGGHGFLERTGVEHILRDAVGSRSYSGTADIQIRVIADSMGL